MGSSPDEVIGFFNWPNPSSCIMALGSTQPLTGMSTRNIPGGWGLAGTWAWQPHRHLWADRLESVGASNSHSPVAGIVFFFFYSLPLKLIHEQPPARWRTAAFLKTCYRSSYCNISWRMVDGLVQFCDHLGALIWYHLFFLFGAK
jgi:hypothetical protein